MAATYIFESNRVASLGTLLMMKSSIYDVVCAEMHLHSSNDGMDVCTGHITLCSVIDDCGCLKSVLTKW